MNTSTHLYNNGNYRRYLPTLYAV